MTRPAPAPRVSRLSFYSPGGETASEFAGGTWIEAECFAYPAGGFTRRARAVLSPNPHNPIVLPYGTARIVLASIPDTFTTVPARLRFNGRTVRGYLSVPHDAQPDGALCFTPEASPTTCPTCAPGDGCKR